MPLLPAAPAAASNLYLSLTSGDEMTIAYVAGPVAFPVGKVRAGAGRGGKAVLPTPTVAAAAERAAIPPSNTCRTTCDTSRPRMQATVYIMHNILGNATLITGGSSR